MTTDLVAAKGDGRPHGLSVPIHALVFLSLFAGCEVTSESPSTRPALRPIRAVPLVFTMPAPEYDSLERWGLEEWSEEEVEALFASMEHDGVDLILLPACVGDTSFYPSEILPNRLDHDAYARLFDLAEKHGMQVILPGILYTYYLQFQGKPWSPQADLEMNRRICQELFDLYGARTNLWGWYIPHETGDRTHRGDVMAILRELPRFLKRLTPDKKVAHSPWFPSRVTLGADAKTPAEFAAEWDSMLSEIEGVDVFVIQDSTAPHEEIGEWFAAAAPVFRKHGAELWSVVELFGRGQDVVHTDMTRAIPFERVLEKMEAAAPYVTAYACWEYQNYLYPRSPVPGAAELSRAYRAHFGTKPSVAKP